VIPTVGSLSEPLLLGWLQNVQILKNLSGFPKKAAIPDFLAPEAAICVMMNERIK
jgi:hypothetical protein